MIEQPLVTVNILSFNRKDELRNTLIKVYEQEYKNIEVIVVDNASNDGSSEMVKKEFPSVNLIQLEKNIGIAGWNEGFKVANGEFVLVLDDDAYPQKNSITIAVDKICNNTQIGIIAFNIFNISQDNRIYRFGGGWLPNDDIIECNWEYFIGCAFMIKKKLFFNDLFSPSYFLCFHELPIIRYIKTNNLIIYFNKEIKAYHQNQSLKGLSPLKEYYHYRNMVNFVIWNLTIPFNLYFGFRIIMFFLTRSIRKKWFKNFLKAFFYQFKNLQGYNLQKMNKFERRYFFKTDFVEYKLSDKIKNL